MHVHTWYTCIRTYRKNMETTAAYLDYDSRQSYLYTYIHTYIHEHMHACRKNVVATAAYLGYDSRQAFL